MPRGQEGVNSNKFPVTKCINNFMVLLLSGVSAAAAAFPSQSTQHLIQSPFCVHSTTHNQQMYEQLHFNLLSRLSAAAAAFPSQSVQHFVKSPFVYIIQHIINKCMNNSVIIFLSGLSAAAAASPMQPKYAKLHIKARNTLLSQIACLLVFRFPSA